MECSFRSEKTNRGSTEVVPMFQHLSYRGVTDPISIRWETVFISMRTLFVSLHKIDKIKMCRENASRQKQLDIDTYLDLLVTY